MPTIAITGANGFIGAHLGEFLVGKNLRVRGLVRPGREDVVRYFGGEPCVVDYFSLGSLVDALEGTSVVFHFAGATRETRGKGFEKDYLQLGRNVIEACRRAGVQKIVANSGLGVAKCGETPLTSNRYFWSRLMLEDEIKRSGLSFTTFRPSTVIGGGHGPIPGDEMTPDLARSLKGQEAIVIIGDARNLFQPIFVGDVVGIYHSCIDGFDRDTFDLVGPLRMSILDYVALIAEGLGVEARFEFKSVEEAREEARRSEEPKLTEEEIDILLLNEVSDHRVLEEAFKVKLTPIGKAVSLILSEINEGVINKG